MRTHPLGIMCVPSTLDETFQAAADMSRTTHLDPRCVVSCCAVVALVRNLIRGEVLVEADIDRILSEAFTWVGSKDELWNPGGDGAHLTDEAKNILLNRLEFEKHVYARTYEELELDDSLKMGYVYKCLGAAVLCLRLAMRRIPTVTSPRGSDCFEELMTELVMYGGDGDTNGCVAGALLGAWVGYSRLPTRWRNGIKDGEWLLQKTEALGTLIGVNKPQAENEVIVQATDTAPDGGRRLYTEKELDERERDLVYRILKKGEARREAEQSAKAKEKGFGRWARDLATGR